MAFGIWHLTFGTDIWHLTFEIWHSTFYILHFTFGIWHLASPPHPSCFSSSLYRCNVVRIIFLCFLFHRFQTPDREETCFRGWTVWSAGDWKCQKVNYNSALKSLPKELPNMAKRAFTFGHFLASGFCQKMSRLKFATSQNFTKSKGKEYRLLYIYLPYTDISNTKPYHPLPSIYSTMMLHCYLRWM